MDSEGASAGKNESCRTPTNWSLLATSPSQMKNRTGPTINARFWDRIYQWIYRHNMSKWDIASRCEMKKKPLQTFRRLLTKLLIWKMTKREAFWHVDVKNTRLCKSVLPMFLYIYIYACYVFAIYSCVLYIYMMHIFIYIHITYILYYIHVIYL